MLAHDIDQAQAFVPERLSTVVETFAQYLLDVVGDFRSLGAAGVAVRGNYGFGQFVNEGVLRGSEEARGGLGFSGLRVKRGRRSLRLSRFDSSCRHGHSGG